MEPIRELQRCRHKQGKQFTGPALVLTLPTTYTGTLFAHSTRPPYWPSQCFPETSLTASGRRSQLTTSTTKVKSTCSSAVSSSSTPSYPMSHPNPPFPCLRSYKNSSPSTDHPASSIQTMACHSHPMSSPSSYSDTTLTTLPLTHAFPNPMASLSVKSRP